MTIILLFVLLSILLAITLFKLKTSTNVLTLIGCYMFSITAIQLTGIIIQPNLKLTTSPSTKMVFWTQKTAELTFKPLFILFLMSLVFSNRKTYKKVITAFLVVTALVLVELLFRRIGYLSNGTQLMSSFDIHPLLPSQSFTQWELKN